MWYTPAEHNHFTGEPNTRITLVRKTITDGEIVAIEVVIRPIRVVVMTIANSGTAAVVTEIEVKSGEIGTMIGEVGTMIRSRHEMMTGVKRLLDHPRTRRTTTKTRTTGIIITGMTGGIVIATGTTGTGVGIAAIGNGIGDTPGTIGRATGTSVRVTTRTKIARDRDRDRGIALHSHHSER